MPVSRRGDRFEARRGEAEGGVLGGGDIEIQEHPLADAGFALPAVYEWCEKEGIGYTIGLISNPRLEALAEPLLRRAERESEARGGEKEKVRLVSDAPYQAGSWERPRRVVFKAEVLEKGANTRFVVTSRRDMDRKSSTSGTLGGAGPRGGSRTSSGR